MKLFMILFFVFAVLGIALCLDCYRCEKCGEKSPEEWNKISCGVYDVPIPPYHVWACLTIDFKNITTSQEEQVRKCVLAEKRDGYLTFNCPTSIGEIRSCEICEKDFCR